MRHEPMQRATSVTTYKAVKKRLFRRFFGPCSVISGAVVAPVRHGGAHAEHLVFKRRAGLARERLQSKPVPFPQGRGRQAHHVSDQQSA